MLKKLCGYCPLEILLTAWIAKQSKELDRKGSSYSRTNQKYTQHQGWIDTILKWRSKEVKVTRSRAIRRQ